MNDLMKTPVEILLDKVTWIPIDEPEQRHVDDIYATHRGTIKILDFTFVCYQLNDGRRVFDVEDVNRFFEERGPWGEKPSRP